MRAAINFSKYQALGNAYLVLPALPDGVAVEPVLVPYLCDWRIGIGSDGVLLGPLPSRVADFRVRIFNPDGGEAEKSGNGLRIFARYLWDKGLVTDARFAVETAGGVVAAQLLESGKQVRVDMGRVVFPTDALLERVQLGDVNLSLCRASIGNPHCVVLMQEPTEATARRLGPQLECHPMFPGRTNVQFMEPLDMGYVVFFYGVSPVQMPQGTSNTILAHELYADTNGLRLVLMGDGSVREMNAEQFAKAPKAK